MVASNTLPLFHFSTHLNRLAAFYLCTTCLSPCDSAYSGSFALSRPQNGITSGLSTIKGQAVESTVGAIFTYYGSPAAHRLYHLHILPRLSSRLKDPALIERAESMQGALRRDFGEGIIPSN
jgi:dsRNA-specific ribonuclease